MNIESSAPESNEEQVSRERAGVFSELKIRKDTLALWIDNPKEYWRQKTQEVLLGSIEDKIDFAKYWHFGDHLQYKLNALNQLASDPSSRVREALAGNMIMSSPDLANAREMLAGDQDYLVRKALAGGSVMIGSKFDHIKKKLIADPNKDVRLAVASHVFVPLILRNELALHYLDEPEEEVRRIIEKRVFRKAKIFVPSLLVARMFYFNGSKENRIKATENILLAMSYPQEAKKLFFDQDDDVRIAAAKSGLVRIFPRVALQLKDDQNIKVREAYKQNKYVRAFSI